MMDAREAISRLVGGGTLSEGEAEGLFRSLLSGEADAAQWGAILGVMQARGVSVDEVVGGARVMRRFVERVGGAGPDSGLGLDPGVAVLDTCGTGGAAKTFNVSTCAAVVAASAAPGRVAVAKHGNRSRTGRGSAEVLRGLGVNVDATREVQARCLREAGVCFCFAIHHHPAMRHAAGPRASLGVPTIFNLLGPLTNPAGASHQLIGVYGPGLVGVVAGALARLGSVRAMVVHSAEGMDEISPCGPTRAAVVEGGRVSERTITPEEAGVERTTMEEIRAGSLEGAVEMFRAVMEGERGGARAAVLMNAGAALWIAGAAGSIGEGARLAAGAIDSGASARTLETLVRVSNEA